MSIIPLPIVDIRMSVLRIREDRDFMFSPDVDGVVVIDVAIGFTFSSSIFVDASFICVAESSFLNDDADETTPDDDDARLVLGDMFMFDVVIDEEIF